MIPRSFRRSISPTRAGVTLALVVLATAVAASLPAQQAALRPGQRPGPTFVVPTFRADSSRLGFEVAGALRNRLAADFDVRALMVVPESAITRALEEAGFAPMAALAPNENRLLASQFRADEYIDGRVERTATGTFLARVDWAMARRDDMIEPLPPVEGRKIADVAKLISAELEAARKQVEYVRQCMELSRSGQLDAAMVQARKAIAVYPRSALGRVCIAGVYERRKFGPDSMIRISEEILSLHSDNQRALLLAADAYHEKGMRDREQGALFALLSLDSTNVRVAEHVARHLAERRSYDSALVVVAAGLRHSAEDAELLALRWRLALAMKDWRAAALAGVEMTRVDSAAADADFFRRMAAVFVEDSQPAQAATIVARGVAKYPADDELALLEAQLWRRAGQLQPALDATDRLLARNPKAAGAWLQRARIQAELKQPADSLLATLDRGIASGEDPLTVAGYAATLGQAVSRSASTTRDAADFRLAVRYFRFAERIAPRDTTTFLLGASSLSLGQVLYSSAREQKSCDQAKEMQAALVDAQVNLTKGGRAFPDAATQLLGRLREVTPFADALEKVVCKTGRDASG